MPIKTNPTATPIAAIASDLEDEHPGAVVKPGEYLTTPYGAFYLQRRVDCGSWISHTQAQTYPGDRAWEILPSGRDLYVTDADGANAAIASFIDDMEAADAGEDRYNGRLVAIQDLREALWECIEEEDTTARDEAQDEIDSPAGYIATDADSSAIWGYGDTAEEAIADAIADESPNEEPRDPTFYKAVPATASLIDQVREYGGAIAWSSTDSTACTIQQAEALNN